jgi:hypothetical protein
MAKPSYKQARQDRKGSATMEIEPSDASSKPVIDLSKPVSHSESLVPPMKSGQVKSPKIVPAESPSSLHADPGTLHPGEYLRPNYSGISRT